MPKLRVSINGRDVMVADGTSVAAAVMNAGQHHFRTSVTGRPRGPLCGMGICYECRLTIDGKRHVKSCQVSCRADMKIMTDEVV